MSKHVEGARGAMQEAAHFLERVRAETDHIIDDYLRMVEQRDALLAACKAAKGYLGEVLPACGCPECEVIEKLETAIAQAEGREP